MPCPRMTFSASSLLASCQIVRMFLNIANFSQLHITSRFIYSMDYLKSFSLLPPFSMDEINVHLLRSQSQDPMLYYVIITI